MRYRSRKKGSNKLIIFLLFLLCSISIGYAAFSSNLNISGTANANGKFNIEFTKGYIIDSQGIDVNNSSVVISDDKTVLNVNIANMQYPGAGATVSCIIKNTGTIPAKLTDVKFTGNNDPDISVTFPDSMAIGQTLKSGESIAMSFVVKWNLDSTLQNEKEIKFTAALLYEQDVTEYTGTAN